MENPSSPFIPPGFENNNQIGRKEGFVPRSNLQPEKTTPRLSLAQAIFGGGHSANKIEKKEETKKEKPFFSSNSSGEKKKAMQFMGGQIRSNPTLMKRLELHGSDDIKNLVSKATGKRQYFRSDLARKDLEALRSGKVEKLSFYQDATEKQRHAIKCDSDTRKGLGNIYEGMFKK